MIIGIGGSASGSGKTTMAEELLKALRRRAEGDFGVIKFTKTEIYTSVVTDDDTLFEEGKDTARMLKAGARGAVWVRSPGGGELSEALGVALQNLFGGRQPLRGVIVEGNSAIELLKPDIVIFMGGPCFKSGAEGVLRLADVVYRPQGAHNIPEAPDAARKNAFFCGDIRACVGAVLKLIDEREGKGSSLSS